MADINSRIKELVTEKLIDSETRKMEARLRLIVRAEIDAYLKTREFSKGIRSVIQGDIKGRLSEYWQDYVPQKQWDKLMTRAVKSIIR